MEERNVLLKKHLSYHQRAFCLRVFLATFSAIVLLAVAGVAIAAIIVDGNQQSLQRNCMEMNSNQLFLDGVVSNGTALATISLRYNEREIEWELQHKDLTSVPINVYIYGPIAVGQDTGPFAQALCGTPSSLACDISEVGKLKGIIRETNPGGLGLKPLIKAIRANPILFYATIGTSNYQQGEIGARFGHLCGTP